MTETILYLCAAGANLTLADCRDAARAIGATEADARAAYAAAYAAIYVHGGAR